MSRTLLLGLALTTPALAGDTVAADGLDGEAKSDEQLDFEDALAEALDVPLPGDAPASRIINGAKVGDDAFPAAGGLLAELTVSFQGQTGDITMFMCSSTLIAPDVVLTAAHCVDEEFLEAQFGGFVDVEDLTYAWTNQEDLSMYTLGGPTALPTVSGSGSAWIAEPRWVGVYELEIGIAENHDIALVFLDEPVLDVQPAYLPLPEEAEQIVTGAPVTIVGWGNQEPVPQGQQPSPGKVAIRQAADSTIAEVGPTEFQVGETPESGRKCQGDSGGPTFQQVVTDRLEAWRVVGVTSHSYDFTQCESKGGVDTRVDHYLTWIDEEMRARCADGTRSWCEEEGILIPPLPADPAEAEGAQACGCSAPATPVSLLPLVGLLGLAGLRRRRRA